MAKARQASLIFIFITVLLDVIGIGIIIPVMPYLIMELAGCTVQEAARISGFLIPAYAVMQFLFAPLLGELSDRYGRRPVLLLSLFGLGFDFLLHAYAPTIAWLFLGRLLAGVCGASFSVAMSYVADISTPKNKAQNFGLVNAAFGLGFIIGPAIGGLVADFSLRAPFYLAAALSLINFAFGLFVLPESLKKENRRAISWIKANPLSTLLQFNRYPRITIFFVVLLLLYIAGHSLQSTWTFFNELRFGWTPTDQGLSLTFVGVMVAFVQAVLIRKVVLKLGNTRTILIGLSIWTLGLFLFSLASQSWMMYAFTFIYCLGGVAGPTIQGLLSNEVPANEQGQLQALTTSVMSVANIIGPFVMTSTFFYFTDVGAPVSFPGAAFLFGSLLIFGALLLVILPLRKLAAAEKARESQLD